jgi:hypothetical protein
MNSVEERLERIERKLDTLLAQLRANNGAGASASVAMPPASSGHEVATDADLDSPRGNPEVRFVPRRWSGAEHKGKRFSECEPEFLDMLAEAYEWFAQRDDESNAVDKNGNPKSRWSRLDASRARGWAARLRGGGGASSAGRASDVGRDRAVRRSGSNGSRPAPSPDDFGLPSEASDDEIPF